MLPAVLSKKTDFMQNRELSWLKFNERVLLEANRLDSPLLERLKFISIFTSNLDEFFMVRVGTLTDYALLGDKYTDNKTGMTAREQLGEIFRAVVPLYILRGHAFDSVMEGLSQHGVHLLKMNGLSPDEQKKLKKHFIYNVMPLLSPQIIDSRHPFPHLSNKQLHIAVTLEKKKGVLFGLIAIPSELDRLVMLESGCRFVLIEDLVLFFSETVFSIYKVLEKNIIAVTRNADIDTEEELFDESVDYRQHMKNLMKKRQRLSPVRLELTYIPGDEFLKFFCGKLSITTAQVFYSSAPLDLSFCYSLDRIIDKAALDRLVWRTHIPAETLAADEKGDMLKTVSFRDLIFSYPYESISPFLTLIHQAAEDPSVISIKITLYRIDAQSKLAESLIRAAENGKEVTVLMELRARFDENNNIEWAQRLEESGCRVIYGPAGYKVHSKICLITRKERLKISHITQIGTGNYNEKTAKLYSDLSLVTANPDIGNDAAAFFSDMMLGNLDGSYEHLWIAPNSFKCNIIDCIEEQRRRAGRGEPGSVIIKCNSLTDKEIIEKLAEASACGVKVVMLIRGICCLIPGIPGLTDNIRVISIVGKFLEHSRIYCFGTGPERTVYISSADLMTRNTQRRIEIACPIFDQRISEELFQMLETMLMDNTQSWEQYSDGRYVSRCRPETDIKISSQEIFIEQSRIAAFRAAAEKESGKRPGESSVVRRIINRVKRRL